MVKEVKANKEAYDVLILGAGPAGLTAAIYAGRYQLKTVVVSKTFGGMANLAGEIDNWPGFSGSGLDLMVAFKKHAEKYGAVFIDGEVSVVKKDATGFFVELEGKIIRAKSLVVALGTEHKQLDIKGEKEFLGKGVSYCATCDAMFFKNKKVVVVGGANSAAKAALYLSELAKEVSIVYRKTQMRCEPISLKKIETSSNIKMYYNATPLEIIGDKKVTGLKIKQEVNGKDEEKLLDVDGVFIQVGATPMTDVVSDLGLEFCDGYIKTDKEMVTSVKGIFAAGDDTNNTFKQVVVAAGEGAVAAKSARDYLKSLE